MRKSLAFSASLVALVAAAPANAEAWYLNGAFDDDTTFAGSFDFTNGRVSGLSVTTQAGNLDTFNYRQGVNSFALLNYPSLNTLYLSNNDQSRYFLISLSQALTGGTVNLTGRECYNCSSVRYITSGTASTSIAPPNPVTSAVPEPITWAMMMLGFGMVGGALRYRHGTTKAVYA